MNIYINSERNLGRIKPLHGIGNAPIFGTSNKLFPYLKEAGIPYSRLHDTGGRFGGSCFVDINNVFRDFERDPKDPEAYDFAFTDWLIKELIDNGVKPFYRLGTTIENSHRIKAYHIYPPKDNMKWAQICEGIIRHYTEGFANGFYYDMEYWEIWNEPDNQPDIEDNPMWKGTMEEFFLLYKIASNHLKECFPHLKIGGYASCGFYYIKEAHVQTANSSTRTGYFVCFFEEFLKYITSEENKSPLDFFSWHSYDGLANNMAYAKYARETLDKFGFNNTESIFNEWNPGIANRGKAIDCVNILAMMLAMQNSSIDKAMYYDGQVNTSYGGIFDPVKQDIFKAYYAFYSFNKLYELEGQVSLELDKEGVYGIAARKGNTIRILLANMTGENHKLNILDKDKIVDSYTITVLDDNHNFEEIETDKLLAYSIALIEFK